MENRLYCSCAPFGATEHPTRDEEQMSSRDPHAQTITEDLHTVYANLHRLSLPTCCAST